MAHGQSKSRGTTNGGVPASRRAVALQTLRSGEFAVRRRTIGIDLGTSTTCVATVVDGRPVIIPSRQGTNTTPSVLSVVPDGSTLVGHAAARRMVLHPEQTVYGSKRLVGRAYTEDLAAQVRDQLTYALARTSDHRFGAEVDGRVISMQEISARVLHEVRGLAEGYFGAEVDGAVITVPAFFGESQREAVRRAAEEAQIPLIRIISEPTAAALAYGYHRGANARVAVVDLGAGTFDVSIVDVRRSKFEVVATGGDTMLGGMDIDHAIMRYLRDQFVKATKQQARELEAVQLARLLEAAQEAKIGLSSQRQHAIHLPCFAEVDGQLTDLRAFLTRETAEELAKPILDRMIETVIGVLESAAVSLESIDEVLFIGRATRWPAFRARMEALFGKRGSRRTDAEEAVAMGAALVADDLGAVELTDVVPLSIGFAGQGRRFVRLIPRNARIPTDRTFVVRTSHDDQASYLLPMFQGESPDAAENEHIGCLVIDGIPPGPKGSREYELTISLDREGLMTCSAVDATTHAPMAVRVERGLDAATLLAALEDRTGASSGVHQKPSAWTSFTARVRSMFGA